MFCLDALVWLAVAAVLALMVLRLETRHWAEQVGRQAEAWMHTCSRHGGSPLLIIQLAVPHTQLRSSRRWLPDCAITSSTLSTHLAPALTPLPPPLARPPARQMFCGALVNHLNVQAGITMVVALLGSAAYALRCFWRLPPGLGLQRHGWSTWRSKAGLNHLLQLAAVSTCTLGVRHLHLNSLVTTHRLPQSARQGGGGRAQTAPVHALVCGLQSLVGSCAFLAANAVAISSADSSAPPTQASAMLLATLMPGGPRQHGRLPASQAAPCSSRSNTLNQWLCVPRSVPSSGWPSCAGRP